MTLPNPSIIVSLLLLALQPCVAWNPTSSNSRRSFVATLTGSALVVATRPEQALAQPTEFANIGTQAPIGKEGETAFTTLDNGVKIKEFKEGSGESVRPGARVSIQCSGRLLNLNGVPFYNTKNNNPDGFGAVPLTFTLGKGEALPGLEAGILGMKKNGIRRIIIPADLAYSKFPDLEPKPMSDLDRRALDSVIKNPRRDATILFDVKLERFK
jgi:FKBP-type peptidyl-prolyl cis-trans isomerase